MPGWGIGPKGSDQAVVYVGDNEAVVYDKDGVLTGAPAPVQRNWVNAGPVDTSSPPKPTFVAIAAGLVVDFSAASTAVVLDFANGLRNLRSVLTTSAAGILTLAAWQTSYVHATYVSPTAVTWGKTLIPFQEGQKFDKQRQALLRFAGANGSTTILDDYGNTWVNGGATSINTTVQIDGMNTLQINTGTTGYIYSKDYVSLKAGSWTMKMKFRMTALPPNNSSYLPLFSLCNAGAYGAQLYLGQTSGVTQTRVYLSGDGTSYNLANSQAGVKTAWAINTDYEVKLTFDAIAGKYFVYVDGVLDTTVTTTTKIANPDFGTYSGIAVGASNTTGGPTGLSTYYVAGFQFLPYCDAPQGTTHSAENVSTLAVKGDWIDTSCGMQCKTASGPSTTAGLDPLFTAVNRIYCAEFDTNATTVVPTTGARVYRYSHTFDSGAFAFSANQLYSFAANLGGKCDLFLYYSLSAMGALSRAEENTSANTGSGGNSNYRGPHFGQKDMNSVRVRTTDYVQVATDDGSGWGTTTGGYLRLIAKRRAV